MTPRILTTCRGVMRLLVEVLDDLKDFQERATKSEKIRAGVLNRDEAFKELAVCHRAATLTYPVDSDHVIAYVWSMKRVEFIRVSDDEREDASQKLADWKKETIENIQEKLGDVTRGIYNPAQVAKNIWR